MSPVHGEVLHARVEELGHFILLFVLLVVIEGAVFDAIQVVEVSEGLVFLYDLVCLSVLLFAFQKTRDHGGGQVFKQRKQAPAVGVHVEVVVVIIVVVIVIVVIVVVVDAAMKRVFNGWIYSFRFLAYLMFSTMSMTLFRRSIKKLRNPNTGNCLFLLDNFVSTFYTADVETPNPLAELKMSRPSSSFSPL